MQEPMGLTMPLYQKTTTLRLRKLGVGMMEGRAMALGKAFGDSVSHTKSRQMLPWKVGLIEARVNDSRKVTAGLMRARWSVLN